MKKNKFKIEIKLSIDRKWLIFIFNSWIVVWKKWDFIRGWIELDLTRTYVCDKHVGKQY